MKCPYCGVELPEDAKFCGNCGGDLRSFAANDAANETAATEVPQAQQQSGYHEETQPAMSIVPTPAPQTSDNVGVPGNAGSPAGLAPLNTKRDIATYIILTIVTCGIYGYYYVYQLAQDANIICRDDGDETQGLGIYILLSIVTCGVYSYYWMYKLADRLKANAPRYNTNLTQGGSEVLLWLILGLFTCGVCSFVAMNIIIENMNKLSERYNETYGLV